MTIASTPPCFEFLALEKELVLSLILRGLWCQMGPAIRTAQGKSFAPFCLWKQRKLR
jgi:hypothetical protein